MTFLAKKWHTGYSCIGNIRTNFGFPAPSSFRVRRPLG